MKGAASNSLMIGGGDFFASSNAMTWLTKAMVAIAIAVFPNPTSSAMSLPAENHGRASEKKAVRMTEWTPLS